MLSLLKRANRNDWHSFKIDIKENDEKMWEKHNVEYLRLHGYKREISTVYYQHMFFPYCQIIWIIHMKQI